MVETILTNVCNISRVHTASNGHEAYTLAMTTSFDIIIMDLNMPMMNGFDSCKKIKQFYNFDENTKLSYDYNGKSYLIKEEQQLIHNQANAPYIVAVSASIFSESLILQC